MVKVIKDNTKHLTPKQKKKFMNELSKSFFYMRFK